MGTFTLNLESLPPTFKHKNITEPCESAQEYTLRANLQNDSDISQWITTFGAATATQWNLKRTRPTLEGGRTLFKEFVCHHSSFNKVAKDDNGCNKRGISKNAFCEARVRISINVLGSKRSRDKYVRIGLCAKIRISRTHTHTLNSATTLRFLQCKDSILRDTFFEYFSDNMIASEAKRFHEHKLTLENVTEADFANGNKNPSSDTVSYWFKQWRLLNLGPRSGSQLIDKLKEKQTLYAEKQIILEFQENPFCVLVSTPLMQRAHSLSSAGDLLFVDSTSACDAGHHSVTFLLTPCAAGAVPLGVIITSGQTAEAYSRGFQLTNVIPDRFGNRGYPKTVITDNSAAEISAIRETWPESTNLLCTFHILQAVWRWLWDSTNGINQDDRIILMNSFKAILNSENLIEMEDAYDRCLKNSVAEKYEKWLRYIQEYYKFKEKWALPYRNEELRGHHTNNFSEASIRIFKDLVLSRVKAYNVIALLDFCVTSLEEYYVGKLRSFANFRNRDSFTFFRKNLSKISYLQKEDIIQVDQNKPIFLVQSETNQDFYTVDTDIGSCTCNAGKFGKFCKHQCAVYQYFHIHAINFPPISGTDRYEIAKIALGDKAAPRSFYEEFLLPSPRCTLPSPIQPPAPVQDISNALNSSPPPICTPTTSVPFQDITNTMNTRDPLASQQLESSHDSSSADESLLEERDELIESIKHRIEEKIVRFKNSADIINGLKKFLKSIDRISTEGLLLKFLHSCPVSLRRFKSGAKINVQPTSIARRKAGVTRGCKKVASGRIAKENPPSSKRPHHISRVIAANLPSSRS